MDNEKFNKEKELLAKQENILAKEEIFWKQKSREDWSVEGDHNTIFFIKTLSIIDLSIEFKKLETKKGI